METEPFVSIVIPTTGEVKFIKGLVESVVELEYPKDKFELVLIGDKSTHLIEKNSKIAKENGIDVNVVYNPVSAGKKRNIGANIAQGRLIAFTDDDTILREDW
ncbi:MAG: glycosyltransferase, partial [Candidatus Thermoplasmatota archaeon]|nr:glycosyltransferase [Candidatus Thermoplasmatota archaeon]